MVEVCICVYVCANIKRTELNYEEWKYKIYEKNTLLWKTYVYETALKLIHYFFTHIIINASQLKSILELVHL